MQIWPFRRRAQAVDAEKLLTTVTRASRDPALFGAGGVPDTLEGRFEVLTLHAALALIRLRREPSATAQEFTDILFSQIDAGLREAGVGDLTVPKKIHRLAGDFYGRLNAYAAALDAGDLAALEAAIARNITGLAPGVAAILAARTSNLAEQQHAQEVAGLTDPAMWAVAAG
jgi:cytochrome b pre-mRNA-processing protein 3